MRVAYDSASAEIASRTPQKKTAVRAKTPNKRTKNENHCPDLTLFHQSEAGTHILLDVTTTATVCSSVLRGAASVACHAAGAAERTKYQSYGAVDPHVVVPFAVEDGGALGKEARRLFFTCRDRCCNQLLAADDDVASWSSRGFSNFSSRSPPGPTSKGWLTFSKGRRL